MRRELFDLIDLANTASAQKFLREYLSPSAVSIIENGVTISGTQIGNRTGLPRSAQTWRYEFKAAGWEMTVRAVWLDGDLFEPAATHCRIEAYGPELETGSRGANSFFRALPL
jgi:hypothetical protein